MHRSLRQLSVAMLTIAVVLPVRLLAQTERPAPDSVREGSLPLAILVVEAYAFETGFIASSSRSGAHVVGAVDGLSGLAVLGIAAFTDRRSGLPEFMVPYGAGLLALSYYNFASASSHGRERKLWTNVIGVNATVLVSVLSGVVLRPHKQSLRSPVLRVTPSGVHLNITF